jgi:hypothetical protein
MIRRLALTAGFAILGAVAFAPKAHAQAAPETEMVPFKGTVGSVCTLSDPREGALVQLNDDTLSSFEVAGGKLGSITVNCTNNNTISVGAPDAVDPPNGFNPVNSFADLTQNGSFFADTSGLLSSVEPGVETVLDVGMSVENDTGALPAGLYKFNVPVTATPN